MELWKRKFWYFFSFFLSKCLSKYKLLNKSMKRKISKPIKTWETRLGSRHYFGFGIVTLIDVGQGNFRYGLNKFGHAKIFENLSIFFLADWHYPVKSGDIKDFMAKSWNQNHLNIFILEFQTFLKILWSQKNCILSLKQFFSSWD